MFRKNRKGWTLIDALNSVGLLLLVFTLVAAMMWSGFQLYQKGHVNAGLQYNCRTTLDTLSAEIREAYQGTASLSGSKILTFAKKDTSTNRDVIIQYALTNEQIIRNVRDRSNNALLGSSAVASNIADVNFRIDPDNKLVTMDVTSTEKEQNYKLAGNAELRSSAELSFADIQWAPEAGVPPAPPATPPANGGNSGPGGSGNGGSSPGNGGSSGNGPGGGGSGSSGSDGDGDNPSNPGKPYYNPGNPSKPYYNPSNPNKPYYNHGNPNPSPNKPNPAQKGRKPIPEITPGPWGWIPDKWFIETEGFTSLLGKTLSTSQSTLLKSAAGTLLPYSPYIKLAGNIGSAAAGIYNMNQGLDRALNGKYWSDKPLGISEYVSGFGTVTKAVTNIGGMALKTLGQNPSVLSGFNLLSKVAGVAGGVIQIAGGGAQIAEGISAGDKGKVLIGGLHVAAGVLGAASVFFPPLAFAGLGLTVATVVLERNPAAAKWGAEKLEAGAKWAGNQVISGASTIGKGVTSVATTVFGASRVTAAKTAVTSTASKVVSTVSKTASIAAPTASKAVSTASRAVSTVARATSTAVSTASRTVSTAVRTASNTVSRAVSTVSRSVSKATSSVSRGASSVASSVSKAVSNGASSVSRGASSVARSIGSFFGGGNKSSGSSGGSKSNSRSGGRR